MFACVLLCLFVGHYADRTRSVRVCGDFSRPQCMGLPFGIGMYGHHVSFHCLMDSQILEIQSIGSFCILQLLLCMSETTPAILHCYYYCLLLYKVMAGLVSLLHQRSKN